MKKYIVEFTSEERKQLQQSVKKGKAADNKICHAQMLLKAEQGNQGPNWPDAQIAEVFASHVTTVERLRKKICRTGFGCSPGKKQA